MPLMQELAGAQAELAAHLSTKVSILTVLIPQSG